MIPKKILNFKRNAYLRSVNVQETLKKESVWQSLSTRLPATDGFKKIFGQEVSKPLLIDFLNDLLVGEKEIKDLKFLNTESVPEIEKGRGAIYDILCTTDQGEHIIVEMQYKEHLNFKERALYYLSRAISTQGETGVGWQFNVKAVYGVFFMNFRFNKEVESGKFRTDVILADRDSGELFCDKLRQVFFKESARAGMRRIVKRLLKKYKYPLEGEENVLNLIMTQCSMWSTNN